MTVTRLHYTRRKRGLLFWEPTPAMQAKGFLPKPLGAETPASIAEAKRLYLEWLKVRDAAPKVTEYPPGTLGAYFDRFTGKHTKQPSRRWLKIAAATRNDYHRAWRHLEPRFARTVITRITVEAVEAMVDEIEAEHSQHERHRALKVLRALLADAIARLQLNGMPNPAKGVPNPQPKGRNAIWYGAEVAHLIRTADAHGFKGTALAIRIAWDTLFSPVDVRTFSTQLVHKDGVGRYIRRERTKTEREAFGYLSAETEKALDAYIESLGFTLLPDAPIIRQRDGGAYRTKDTFAADFRDVRRLAFGKDERRQLLDLRRSGNVEADAADADKATMAEILANSMDTSKFLDETYTPPTITKAREVAKKRLAGRAKLAAESARHRSN